MICEQVKELFTDYLEGRLAPKVQSDVKKHLSRCQDCHEELEAERALCQWLGSRKTVPVSANFASTLMVRIGVAVPKPPRWFESLLELSNYWAPSLAALLVMIFAGRTLIDWIAKIRSFSQQAVGAIEHLPSDSPVSQMLHDSILSSHFISTFPLGTLLILVAVGGLAFGIVRILKN